MKRKMSERLLALLAMFCLLFSAIPFSSAVADEVIMDTAIVLPVVDDSLAQLRASLSPVEPNLNEYIMSEGDLSVTELKTAVLNDKDIPEILNNEEFDRTYHVNRLYDQEEDLNTILFQNVDGTKSMYMYPFGVKYENEAGLTVDKPMSMIQSEYAVLESLQEEALSITAVATEIPTLPTPIIEHPGQGPNASPEATHDDGIHDLTIVEGYPEMLTGRSQRAYVGTTTALGRSRMYVRFPYLIVNPIFEKISDSQIIEARYKVYKEEARYGTTLYPALYTGIYWNEDVANYNTPEDIWDSMVFLAGMEGAVVPAAEGWQEFDITQAVKCWKSGSEPISQGIVIIESGAHTAKSYYQEFYTVEGAAVAGQNFPSLIITWRPETQTTIQDGMLYAIKNQNGNYLTINDDSSSINLSSKSYAYYGTDLQKDRIDYNTLDPKQLWLATSIDKEVYRFYSVRKTGVVDLRGREDGFVLSTNGTSVILSKNSSSAESKWILQKYNDKIYFVNAEYNECFLGVDKNTGALILTTENSNLTWELEKINVKDTYPDILPKAPEDTSGVIFNFIVHDSAIFEKYTMEIYEQAVEKWSGISSGLVLRIYTEHDTDILSADRTVHIKGCYDADMTNDNAFAETEVLGDADGIQISEFDIRMNKDIPGNTERECTKIILHEMGHAFLLVHPNDGRYQYRVASVMNAGEIIGEGYTTTEISQYDRYNLKKIWG